MLRTLARANNNDKARERWSHSVLVDAIWEAVDEQWKQMDIVKATGLTRERIRQICDSRYRSRAVTFARYPQAKEWALAQRAELGAMHAEISEATGIADPEWLAVRTWLALTHPDSDPTQQNRRLTSAIMRRLDGQKVSDAVQMILERHLATFSV